METDNLSFYDLNQNAQLQHRKKTTVKNSLNVWESDADAGWSGD